MHSDLIDRPLCPSIILKKNQYQQPAIDDYAVMVPGVRGLYHVRLDKVFK